MLALLAAEATLVTLLAGALGLAAGIGIAWILVKIVNPQSFHWTMELRVPGASLTALAAALLAAAALTSTLAGPRALALRAPRAVQDHRGTGRRPHCSPPSPKPLRPPPPPPSRTRASASR